MKDRRRHVRSALVAVLLALAACAGEQEAENNDDEPLDPTVDTCVLCSMVVSEQPVPRAQVVHRDGARVFLCAVSELPPYLGAPSSHGKPTSVFVEVLPSDDAGSVVATNPHPWIDARGASFVVDGPPRPVMGTPVLTYASEVDAREVAEMLRGRVLGWNELLGFLVN